MLVDYLEGRKQGPLTPDGWVFIADALVAAMNSFDDQSAVGGIRFSNQEPRVRHTYVDLGALDVRDTTTRLLHRNRLGETRLDDLRISAFGAANLITKACDAGRIKSATRRVTGGPLVPLASYKWGLDDPWQRFWQCQMDPQKPFAWNCGHWIFVEETALFAEIDAWRVKYGLSPNWTEVEWASFPAPVDALPVASDPNPPIQSEQIGNLPPNAKPTHKKHAPFAHQAAILFRTGQVPSIEAACRAVAPDEPMRDPKSVVRAIRGAFDLMYDKRGMSIRN